MACYRIYYVNENGSIKSGHDADCDTHDDAFDLAHRLRRNWPRVEVWLGAHLIGCLSSREALKLWSRTAAPARPAPSKVYEQSLG